MGGAEKLKSPGNLLFTRTGIAQPITLIAPDVSVEEIKMGLSPVLSSDAARVFHYDKKLLTETVQNCVQ